MELKFTNDYTAYLLGAFFSASKYDPENKKFILTIYQPGNAGDKTGSLISTLKKGSKDFLTDVKEEFVDYHRCKKFFEIENKELVEALLEYYDVKNEAFYKLPDFVLSFSSKKDSQSASFLSGFFDLIPGFPYLEICCDKYTLNVKNLSIFEEVQTLLQVFPNMEEKENSIEISESSKTNTLDFLGKIYEYTNIGENYSYYKSLCGITDSRNKLIWTKTRSDAVAPFKQRVSDSGYDLTILSKVKQKGLVEFYDTGIAIQPPFGWYFDVLPRSSISGTGYILVNSTGVIDRAYTGSILVPLMKIDPNAPSLSLPNRLVQIIPRNIVHFQTQEVESLTKTTRGSGGFGSTNK